LLEITNKRVRERLDKAGYKGSVLFQCDMDWPAIAGNLGWRSNYDYKARSDSMDMIYEARAFLEKRDGRSFRGSLDDYFPDVT